MEANMPTSDFNHPLFGLIKFRTVLPTWTFGGDIVFLDGFNTADIKSVFIPQLENVQDANGGNLRFHERVHAQVLMAFADIERLGLLHHIKTCAGSLNFRLRRPVSGVLSKKPSNHAFGIAIDMNADDGSLGASVAPVAPVFEALGFVWGKAFQDPMHFEVKKIIDHPTSIAQNLTTMIGSAHVGLAAINFNGEPLAPISNVEKVFGVKAGALGKTSVKITVGGKSKTLTTHMIGGKPFVSLPQAAGVAKLKTVLDNKAKTAFFEPVG
jgi:hypothetical protein